MFKHINQINEQSFLIDFGSEINTEINNYVNLFSYKILNDSKSLLNLKIKNCVPSYNKILIQFDPIYANKSKIIDYLQSIKFDKVEKIVEKIIKVPICYDDLYALDLKEISEKIQLSKKEIIEEHLKTLFHVYMVGFMPGLPFMGTMNKFFSISRKNTPRINVPKGSVGIVDRLCVIYPQSSPGGWNIIGRTPIKFFFDNKKNPLLINPSNKIKFQKISSQEFLDYND